MNVHSLARAVARLLVAALLLAGAPPPAQATNLTGTFHKPDGTPVNGRLILLLSQPARLADGSAQVVPMVKIFSVTNGQLEADAFVYGNDVLLPAGTHYVARLVDASNNLLFEQKWSIQGQNLDLGTLTPTTIGVVVPDPLLKNIAVEQAVEGPISFNSPLSIFSLILHGNISPADALSYDLGSETMPWRRLQVGEVIARGPSPWVDVRAFGAAGDCVANDAAAIQAAINAAGASGTVFVPPSVGALCYRLASPIAVPFSELNIIAYGAVFRADLNGTVLTFGTTGARRQRMGLRGGRFLRFGSPSVDWTAGNIAIRVLNSDYGTFTDFSITGFEQGIVLHADGAQGCSYNEFRPRSITSTRRSIVLQPQAANSWVNENHFFGGSCGYSTTDPNAAGGYCIYIDKGSGIVPNNNKFLGISLESPTITNGNPSALIYDNGLRNQFIGLRYEAAAGIAHVDNSGADYSDGQYAFGRGLEGFTDGKFTATTGTAAATTVLGRRQWWFGGGQGGGHPMVVFREVNSSNNNAIQVRATNDLTVLEISSNGAVHFTPRGLTLANGDNNDVAPSSVFNKIGGPTAAFAITGFSGGAAGRLLYVWNATNQTMTIKNQNTGSQAGNRILTLTGGDVTLRADANSFATFLYDTGASRWVLVTTN